MIIFLTPCPSPIWRGEKGIAQSDANTHAVIAMSVSEEAIQKPVFHALPFALDFVLNSDLPDSDNNHSSRQ
jgi:hypothetical protein